MGFIPIDIQIIMRVNLIQHIRALFFSCITLDWFPSVNLRYQHLYFHIHVFNVADYSDFVNIEFALSG